MSRKGLFGAVTPGEGVKAVPSPAPSVRRFGSALGDIREQVARADEIEKALAAGERIIDVDPNVVDPSPVRDRLEDSGAETEGLRRSIAETGQRSPVLLRPSSAPGRYVTVFGHRRVAAARQLGRSVKAIVTELDEFEALVAQGVENAERRDLTFIERALFARKLSESGLTHERIATALAAARSTVTTMISLARGLPDPLIIAIGRAPKLGEPRWRDLSRRLDAAGRKADPVWRKVVDAPGFSELGDEDRLRAVVTALDGRSADLGAAIKLKDDSGVVFGSAHQTPNGGAKVRLVGDKDLSFRTDQATFGEWLAARLPELRKAWRRNE